MTGSRGFWFFVVILIGFGIGLYFAWMVYPLRIVDSTYHDLRQDYKTDYVLMVAEVYHKDRKRFDAIIRLDRLDEESTEATIKRAIENAEKLGYPESDVDMLYALNAVISGQTEDNLRPDEVYIDFNPLQSTSTPTAEPAPIIEIGEAAPEPSDALPTPIAPTVDNPFLEAPAADPTDAPAIDNPFLNPNRVPSGSEPFLTQGEVYRTPTGEPFSWD